MSSNSGRLLLGGYADSYEEIIQNDAIYNPFFFEHDAEYSLILSSFELLLVLFLWLICINVKAKQYSSFKFVR